MTAKRSYYSTIDVPFIVEGYTSLFRNLDSDVWNRQRKFVLKYGGANVLKYGERSMVVRCVPQVANTVKRS